MNCPFRKLRFCSRINDRYTKISKSNEVLEHSCHIPKKIQLFSLFSYLRGVRRQMTLKYRAVILCNLCGEKKKKCNFFIITILSLILISLILKIFRRHFYDGYIYLVSIYTDRSAVSNTVTFFFF